MHHEAVHIEGRTVTLVILENLDRPVTAGHLENVLNDFQTRMATVMEEQIKNNMLFFQISLEGEAAEPFKREVSGGSSRNQPATSARVARPPSKGKQLAVSDSRKKMDWKLVVRPGDNTPLPATKWRRMLGSIWKPRELQPSSVQPLIGSLYGDQQAARECYLTTLKSSSWKEKADRLKDREDDSVEKVKGQIIELKQEVEKVQVLPLLESKPSMLLPSKKRKCLAIKEEKNSSEEVMAIMSLGLERPEPVESPVEICLRPDRPERTLKIRPVLNSEIRDALVTLLREFEDVFAYTVEEMPEIDPEVAPNPFFPLYLAVRKPKGNPKSPNSLSSPSFLLAGISRRFLAGDAAGIVVEPFPHPCSRFLSPPSKHSLSSVRVPSRRPPLLVASSPLMRGAASSELPSELLFVLWWFPPLSRVSLSSSSWLVVVCCCIENRRTATEISSLASCCGPPLSALRHHSPEAQLPSLFFASHTSRGTPAPLYFPPLRF
ncbi:hypothetical protein BVRB_8g187890 [Beta vulgaris subsp. vulgaris]|nr:hypothetical protein BVRB_8g187890 [Beta vulgaris subsp. vulgaris]